MLKPMNDSLAKISIRKDAEVRKAMLIEATLHCLEKFGYADTSIGKICETAKVSRGLINHHFNSKDELISESFRVFSENLRTETTKAVKETKGGAVDKLSTMIKISFQAPIYSDSNLGVWLSLWNAARQSPIIRQTIRQSYQEYRFALRKLFSKVFEERQLIGNASQAAMALTALIDGLWLQRSYDPEVFQPEEAEAICFDLLYRLIGRSPESANALSSAHPSLLDAIDDAINPS